MIITSAHNPNQRIRFESSAGGVFSMIAENIISDSGVVYGVTFDKNWNIIHRRIERIEDLKFLRGSKYAFSNIGKSIENVITDLNSGRRVLFTGTPCQAAAVRKAAGPNKNLLIVEVVCHGAPDHKYWERYLFELCKTNNRNLSEISSVNFRDKCSGWKNYSFTVKFKDGKTISHPHDDNPYMKGFLSNLTLKDSCFKCPFKQPNGSKADITIGDFWGINKIDPEHDNNHGSTLIIINTEKGHNEYLTLNINHNYAIYDLEEVAKYNPAITSKPIRPKNLNLFRKESDSTESLIFTLNKYSNRNLSFLRRLILQIKRYYLSVRSYI